MTRGRETSRPWAAFGAACAAVVALNFALHGVRARADLSRGGIYSVSPASLRFLRGLPSPVIAEVYSSPELPAQAASSREYLLDMLDELRDGSGGNLRVTKISVDSPETSERAEHAGIPAVRFDVVERDKFETREGRLGVRLSYGKAQRVLPFVTDAATLEYELVGRVRQMTQPGLIGLGFARAAGSVGAESLPTPIRRRFFERYDLRTVDLSSAAEAGFAPDLKVLALFGPKGRLSDRELYALDRFLAGGGSLLLAADAKSVDLREFAAAPLDVGLSSWTASKGAAVRDALVFDRQNQPIQITVPEGRASTTHLVQYPPFVAATDLAAHPAAHGLGSVVFPFVSPVELLPLPGLRSSVLVRSTPYSWLVGEGAASVGVSPFALKPPPADAKIGPFVLAAALEGTFAPYFTAPPKGVKNKLPPLVPKPGRLIVVGTSHFIDAGLVVPESDFVFLLNTADWLAADDDLIAVRTKAVAFAPLAEVSAPARAVARWSLILLPPYLAVLCGLAAWRRRRRRRIALQARYGSTPPSGPASPAPAAS
jgi:ABC-type uncharacterized transport system involved in gliding motility auxiliary subunit